MIEAQESTTIEEFKKVRNATLAICKPLRIEDYVPQPVEFVSPAKWHLGHTTWFYEEFILKKHSPGYKEFHQDFGYMFNSYYNLVGKYVLRAHRGNMSRPSVEEIMAYRNHVDSAIQSLLIAEASEEVIALLMIGLNHEQQHQELLYTDIKYTFGHNPLFPTYQKGGSLVSDINSADGWISIEEGLYEIGHEGEGFSYDNEHGRHRVFLNEYEISKSLVTNAEYLEFIQDKGYSKSELWLDEGWTWINDHNVEAPLYWHKMEGEWHYYTLGGLRKLEPDAILAHASHYEAAAFAEWKGERLPTEAEWEIASDDLDWGNRWEHTNSAYLAYPGFQKPEGAVGEYNGKFMMNQMVQRGGSVATSEDHSRKTYRNFFHSNMQWQFSGIRLAKK